MAIFGVPQAHDDDAHRAIAAGLELRHRVRDDPMLGERLPIRIGINTGEVAIGGAEPGKQAFVAGDAVNVAARLQQQAEPWSVLVAERTANAALTGFSFGPAITIEPRGRTTAVAAREVLGEHAPTAIATPFVGRDSDLDQLTLLSRRAFAEGRPWLVTIVAPPGTGKTRLLNEYLAVVSTGPEAPRIVVARCLPYGQQLAYQPLRAVVDGIVGLDGDEPAEEVMSTLQGLADGCRREPPRADGATPCDDRRPRRHCGSRRAERAFWGLALASSRRPRDSSRLLSRSRTFTGRATASSS